MQTLTRLSQEEDAVPQERIDFVEIDSDFKLQEAIESLKFYYNLARRTNTPLAFELWAPVGSVRPPRLPSHTMKLVEV